jgi:ring-1,2-phenylacetyl-CoA epoxidase subunit PaaD
MVSTAAVRTGQAAIDAVWQMLAMIPDPEIPVISIVDLGIVRGIEWREGELVVTVTPTYSGCPATEVIMADIERALRASGIVKHRVQTQLAPAWTTDWIASEARERLRNYGIAPPGAQSAAANIDIGGLRRRVESVIACPRCGSSHTRELSRFGSTPCKAQYRCEDCLEPFDYFKPH